MATTSLTQQAVVSPRTSATQVAVSPPSRREFLNYIWAASFFMLFGQFTMIGLWFGFPRFKAGEFGAVITFDPGEVPQAGASPASVPSGRFHVSHLENDSLVVLYQVCTHLGCIPKWVTTNNRFECPCHGSKYELSGKYIEGPAPRSLDRFRTSITFTDGTTATTNEEGAPIPLQNRPIAAIQINTAERILRNGRV